MKHLLFALSAYTLSSLAFAGDVTISNTFSSGQPALAADVNQNFSDVKTAVDDNNSRLTTVEGIVPNKQDRVSGTCPAGESIREIAANGTVTCEVDNDSGGTVTSVTAGAGLSGSGTATDPVIKQASGHVALTGNSYRVNSAWTSICQANPANFFSRVVLTNSLCVVQTPVFFPDGATLVSMTCTFNTDANSTINFALRYGDPATSVISDTFQIASSTLGTTGFQTVSDTTAFNADRALVDNSSRLYFISSQVTSSVFPAEAVIMISGCFFEYTF